MTRYIPAALGAIALAFAIPGGFLLTQAVAPVASPPAAPIVLPDDGRLAHAERAVHGLSQQLTHAEQALAAAERDASDNLQRRQALGAHVTRLRAEVDHLTTDLEAATTERNALRDEIVAVATTLADTQDGWTRSQASAQAWQDEATEHAWHALRAEAKQTVCTRGTRKRHARCHAAVDAWLDDAVASAAQACIREGAAAPTLQPVGPEGVPDHGVAQPDDRAFTERDWSIQLCDPSLPEGTPSDEDLLDGFE